MDTTIHINVADIPPEVGESFGRVTLAGFKKFIAQPGNREKLEAQMAAVRLAKKGSVRNDPDSDDRVRHHRRTGPQLVPWRRSLL